MTPVAGRVPGVIRVQRGSRQQLPLAQKPFHRWTFPDGTVWIEFLHLPNAYLIRFPGLADFEVSADGGRTESWPAPGVQPATVENLYLNQVLPLALSRQGKVVLHASAVEMDGRCVAFVGASGRGKSTIAASFATTGMRFLTDDGLQLEWREHHLIAVPSHPSIRLWDDSQTALIGETQEAAAPVEYTSKARFLASQTLAHCEEPRPLHALFFLGSGESAAISIARMKPPVALVDLVRHTFLLDIDEQEMLAAQFEELSRIANLPIHYHLDYPRRFADLPRLREAIVRHVNE
jgi:hypothetical protein